MSTNYHTPYVDGTTEFKADDMNSPLSELDTAITNVVAGEIDHKYAHHFNFLGSKPSAGQLIDRHVITRDETLPNGATNSQGSVVTDPAGAITMSIRKNTALIGTVNIAAGSNTATFTVAGDKIFAAGDVLDIIAPNPQDADLEDISITLVTVYEA